jgi:thiol-disulfide isomerase/thioredoxin
MSLLTLSVILLWVLFALLTVMVLLVYRQFGLMYLGASTTVRLRGVAIGRQAPSDVTVMSDVGPFTLDWSAPGEGRATMLVLAGAECPLCERLVPKLNEFVETWAHRVDVTFVDRTDDSESFTRALPEVRNWRYGYSPGGALHNAFDIEAQPYAYLIDSRGIVVVRDIVNTTTAMATLLGTAIEPDGSLRRNEVVLPIQFVSKPEPNGNGQDTAQPSPGPSHV